MSDWCTRGRYARGSCNGRWRAEVCKFACSNQCVGEGGRAGVPLHKGALGTHDAKGTAAQPPCGLRCQRAAAACALTQAVREHALCFKSIWDQPALPSNGAVAGNGGNSPNAASSGSNGSTSTSGRPAAPPREFSTWKYRSKGESKRVIDYIWFSGNGLLRPLQRWRMLTEAEIGPDGLPSRSVRGGCVGGGGAMLLLLLLATHLQGVIKLGTRGTWFRPFTCAHDP